MKHLMMNPMKVSTILLLLIFVAFFTAPTFGMELSPAQKELWSMIQTFWEVWEKGDMETWKSYWHEDYIWWGPDNLFPITRAEWAIFISSYQINSFKLEPVAVRILGNVAIVQYYWSLTDLLGKVLHGRNAVTFIKQDGKWKSLGAMSASCSFPVRCLK